MRMVGEGQTGSYLPGTYQVLVRHESVLSLGNRVEQDGF